MERVKFVYNNGQQKEMQERFAVVLQKLGKGMYQTRDMQAARPVPVAVVDDGKDSAGEVWDAEIHAASKVKNKDGTWRKKPGAIVDKE